MHYACTNDIMVQRNKVKLIISLLNLKYEKTDLINENS